MIICRIESLDELTDITSENKTALHEARQSAFENVGRRHAPRSQA